MRSAYVKQPWELISQRDYGIGTLRYLCAAYQLDGHTPTESTPELRKNNRITEDSTFQLTRYDVGAEPCTVKKSHNFRFGVLKVRVEPDAQRPSNQGILRSEKRAGESCQTAHLWWLTACHSLATEDVGKTLVLSAAETRNGRDNLPWHRVSASHRSCSLTGSCPIFERARNARRYPNTSTTIRQLLGFTSYRPTTDTAAVAFCH